MGIYYQVILWMIVFDLLSPAGGQQNDAGTTKCLTGHMTDVQTWVDERGQLTNNIDFHHSLDLSTLIKPSSAVIQSALKSYQSEHVHSKIRYLSLAHCSLTRVPQFFDSLTNTEGRYITETLEYLTLYGNNFLEVSVPGKQYDVEMTAANATEIEADYILRGQRRFDSQPSDFRVRVMWSVGLHSVAFNNLRELDLRQCGIATLEAKVFENMPHLEALYLGDNLLHTITGNAFFGLSNLKHLDLSNNHATENENPKPLSIETQYVFSHLKNLTSLDLSNTRLNVLMHAAFRGIGSSLQRLSLCNTGLMMLEANFFNRTSLKILDVSGNHGILIRMDSIDGLRDTLKVLYASDIGLTTFEIFENFYKLEILALANNEISNVRKMVAKTLPNLQVIDLRRNRVTAWFSDTYSQMRSLRVLDVRDNMINFISEDMMADISNISYVGLSGNPVVCNCNVRDFIEIASRNEMSTQAHTVQPLNPLTENTDRFSYHKGFTDVNTIIQNRKRTPTLCEGDDCDEIDLPVDSNFLLLDYEDDTYTCLKIGTGGKKMSFCQVQSCRDSSISLESSLESGKRQLVLLLVVPGLLLPTLALIFVFRRNLRYCYVTMRNSAMLSMVNKNKIITDDTSFTYDVFVSYCNDDRAWVLDRLLGRLETDCSVSLCLHERDFQVGVPILENIVSCMDRSRCIMLVISQQFLLSQWCQFELHLAQHRLLETRREDLILILLEDIPRRLRPNTLHYLMLTKTYIVWPKNEAEEHIFWKRLKKSVVTQKQKTESV